MSVRTICRQASKSRITDCLTLLILLFESRQCVSACSDACFAWPRSNAVGCPAALLRQVVGMTETYGMVRIDGDEADHIRRGRTIGGLKRVFTD